MMTSWLAFLFFTIDHVIQVLQYVALAIISSNSWTQAIYDFLEGLDFVTFEVKDEVYLAIVIACISIILLFSVIALLAFIDIVDVDCCESIEEWVSISLPIDNQHLIFLFIGLHDNL